MLFISLFLNNFIILWIFCNIKLVLKNLVFMKRWKMEKKVKRYRNLKYIILLVFTCFTISLGSNKFLKTDFNDLPKLYRQVIEEYDKFQKSDNKLWKDYKLEEKDVLIFNKNILGNLYLLTKDRNINSLFVKKIKTDNSRINVYRISKIHPKRFEY